jgi:hypothetical protein
MSSRSQLYRWNAGLEIGVERMQPLDGALIRTVRVLCARSQLLFDIARTSPDLCRRWCSSIREPHPDGGSVGSRGSMGQSAAPRHEARISAGRMPAGRAVTGNLAGLRRRWPPGDTAGTGCRRRPTPLSSALAAAWARILRSSVARRPTGDERRRAAFVGVGPGERSGSTPQRGRPGPDRDRRSVRSARNGDGGLGPRSRPGRGPRRSSLATHRAAASAPAGGRVLGAGRIIGLGTDPAGAAHLEWVRRRAKLVVYRRSGRSET